MGDLYHFRERDGKKFAARNPEQLSLIDKAARLLEKDLDIVSNGEMPGLFYDKAILRRQVWKKGK